tara:strand:- start:1146 stop:1640 length:495 start_codon:yes stop_codon:yes gene_type:complete
MATYIADELGVQFAELSGSFTTNEVTKVTAFGVGGEGDTLFILPSAAPWVLIEVYDVEGVYGALGYHKYTTTTSGLTQMFADARTIASTEYTTYKITAIDYKGDNTADVYRGDEITAVTIDNVGTSFTPPIVSWKLSTNLTTPIHQVLICADSYECAMDWVCDP